jgi:hypothetical protein
VPSTENASTIAIATPIPTMTRAMSTPSRSVPDAGNQRPARSAVQSVIADGFDLPAGIEKALAKIA